MTYYLFTLLLKTIKYMDQLMIFVKATCRTLIFAALEIAIIIIRAIRLN